MAQPTATFLFLEPAPAGRAHALPMTSTRLLTVLTATLLVLAVVTGGDSQDRGWGDALTQLLAWPVLLLAVWRLASDTGGQVAGSRPAVGSTSADAPTAVVPNAVVPTVSRHRPRDHDPATAPPPRSALRLFALALAAAVPLALALQWLTGLSLAPWASERALWAVLPALAAFLAALALPPRELQRLAWLVVGLASASLVLGYLQLGAPQDSPLNPFPQWAPALNGLYANPNHQATSIAVALVLVLAWLLHDDGRERDGRWWATRVAVAGLGLFLLVGLPLTGSRGALLVALAGLLAVPLANGWLGRRWRRHRRLALVASVGGAVAAAVLLLAAHGWLKVDRQDESRSAVFAATASMAREASPGGIGVGGFVPWCEAHAPAALVQGEYFNHAHSEYPQWWLESGVAGLAWIAALVVLVMGSRPRPGRGLHPEWLHVGAWIGMVVVLAHSAVDYPLRTPALMTLTALLAGIGVARALATATQPRVSTHAPVAAACPHPPRPIS